ncbi:MAG TPA: hypothetical protein VG407_15340 [Caulobacteraceae bacterium]|jgi:hypothetical protein|nr:hypothetical protein [Caulobacteraceae bacterium]
MSHKVHLVVGAAALLFASQAAAFPSFPGFKPKPKSAVAGATATPAKDPGAPVAGVYFVSQTEMMIYVVDASTIATGEADRRTANVYVLQRNGAHRRDNDDFDCKAHMVRKTGGFDFSLTADGAEVKVVKSAPWKADHIDPAGSIIRETEDFVCRWPASAGKEVLLSGMPEDEHARMIKLGAQAHDIFK